MYVRRLILLSLLVVVWFAVLGGQLTRLTIARGEGLRREAEARLVREQLLPTVRGRVLDRHGRVLAHDRPSFNAAVAYRVIDGSWAATQARRHAQARWRAEWPDLSDERREQLVTLCHNAFRAHLARAWAELAAASGIPRDELDSRKSAVLSRVARLEADIYDRRERGEIAAAAARGTRLTPKVRESIRARVRSQRLAEHDAAHRLVSGVTDTVGFALMRLEGEQVLLPAVAGYEPVASDLYPLVPGLSVTDGGGRARPFDAVDIAVDQATLPGPLRAGGSTTVRTLGAASLILGTMRDEPFAEDIAARARLFGAPSQDLGRYRPGDRAGATGIEHAHEHTLRGLRGLRAVSLDTGEVRLVNAQNGRDLTLTIDVMLQARIQAVMDPALGLARVQPWHRGASDEPPRENEMKDGTPLNGAAVVIDVATGEILALVSTPTPDDSAASPERSAWAAIDQPYLNRAVAGVYPPGSIAKAIILPVAVTRGHYRLGERIDCTGHLLPNRTDIFRCWTYREVFHFATHNSRLGRAPDEIDALMASCNIFFFTLGRRLGSEGVRWTYDAFGVGRPFALGIGHEEPGLLGERGDPQSISAGQATQMGIGQGPVAWTPLHAANAYAILARGGVAVTPRLIATDAIPEAHPLGLNAAAIGSALQGLRRAVTDPTHGTGHHLTLPDGRREPFFNVPGVTVWGKTGTAESSPMVADPDGEGPLPRRVVRSGSHSWFVALVGDEGHEPKYSIAVLMEYAGSGGRVSGPIVNQVIWALVAEGYLKGSSATPPGSG